MKDVSAWIQTILRFKHFSSVITGECHYQMALVVESGRFEIVLRQQASHLFLKCTKLGYGTVLTAACAREACIATHYLLLSFRMNAEIFVLKYFEFQFV
jgi:hypothetical protein